MLNLAKVSTARVVGEFAIAQVLMTTSVIFAASADDWGWKSFWFVWYVACFYYSLIFVVTQHESLVNADKQLGEYIEAEARGEIPESEFTQAETAARLEFERSLGLNDRNRKEWY